MLDLYSFVRLLLVRGGGRTARLVVNSMLPATSRSGEIVAAQVDRLLCQHQRCEFSVLTSVSIAEVRKQYDCFFLHEPKVLHRRHSIGTVPGLAYRSSFLEPVWLIG